MGGAFADNGCAVFYTAGEADREMAQYCRDTPSCGALLGKNSDFFVLPVARYLPLDSLDLRASVPRVTVYRHADVLDALQLDEPLLTPSNIADWEFTRKTAGLDAVLPNKTRGRMQFCRALFPDIIVDGAVSVYLLAFFEL